MLLRLLVWLRPKCPCGGWLPLVQRYPVHVADITLADGTEEAIHLSMRPCKTCGRATSRPKVIKLKKSRDVAVMPGSSICTYVNQETGECSREPQNEA